MIIANLAENEEAYTKLHGEAITKDSLSHQDKDTEIPAAGQSSNYIPDSNLLLYSDDTLDGRSPNRYFYKIEAVGQNVLPSQLSLSTPPVECPNVTPVAQPIITKITGGENQITLCWAKNPKANISGYLVYRTAEKEKASDYRRMILIKDNDTDDQYSVPVTSNLPDREFEFIDNNVQLRQSYYYRVIAMSLGQNGKKLKSQASKSVTAQAYNMNPPLPTPITALEWVWLDDNGNLYEAKSEIPDGRFTYGAARISWVPDANQQYRVEFKGNYMDRFNTASDWLDSKVDHYIHLLGYDKTSYEYRLLTRGSNGLLNTQYLVIELISNGA